MISRFAIWCGAYSVGVAAALAAGEPARAATAADARDGGRDDGYCAYVDAVAAGESALQMAPSAVLRGERLQPDTVRTDEALLISEDSARSRYGLEWGLAGIYRGFLTRRQAEEACRVHRLAAELEAALGGMREGVRAVGLRAKRELLVIALPELAERKEEARQKLRAGAAALPELDAAAEALARLKSEKLAVDAELAALEAQAGAVATVDPAALLARWQQATTELAAVERAQREARAWDVNLVAGMQHFSAGSGESAARFAGLELRYNLGAVARIGDSDSVDAAYVGWRRRDPVGAADRFADAAKVAAVRLAALDQLVAIADERLGELTAYEGSLSGSKSAGGLDQVRMRRMLAAGDRAALAGERDALRAMLQPASASPAPATPARPLPRAPEDPSAPTAAQPMARNDVANFRIGQAAADAERAAVELIVRGYSKAATKLGSGEVRHQLGLMLRRHDECNLVYVMWRPEQHGIFVQEKLNPGKSTHGACANDGYAGIKPSQRAEIAPLVTGRRYRLQAAIAGGELQVRLDDQLVWRGPAPTRVGSGGGIGFRSDNLELEYALKQE